MFRQLIRHLSTLIIILCGIVLPAATLIIECTMHWCGATIFDPIPGMLHPFLIATVPIANLAALSSRVRTDAKKAARALLLCGVAGGIGMIYALVFAQITPMAIFVIPFFGLGLLPLAPLFSIVATTCSAWRIGKDLQISGARPHPIVARGVAAAVILFLVAEIPVTCNRIGVALANSSDKQVELRGIRLLRTFGDRSLLRRTCQPGPDFSTGLLPLNWILPQAPGTEASRAIYYRAFGTNCLSESIPDPNLPDFLRFGIRTASADQVSQEMVLAGSRLDTSIDAQGLVSYTEWILVVKNYSNLQREGRAQLLLPPDGVVSRVTLWINGKEQEAVFGDRDKVTKAYENVVRVERDPVLVTYLDRSKVQMRLFPVTPRGGEMKVRIGITAPLQIAGDEKVGLRLPRIAESNFVIPRNLDNRIWIDSRAPLSGNHENLKIYQTPDGAYSLRGAVPSSDYEKIGGWVEVERQGQRPIAWSYDPRDPEHFIVSQRLQRRAPLQPERLILVVDGSEAMRDYRDDLQSAPNSAAGPEGRVPKESPSHARPRPPR